MTEELKQKAEEYAEKQCENCSCRCDRPNMFKRLSDKKECYAYFRSYEGYIAGAKENGIQIHKTNELDFPESGSEVLCFGKMWNKSYRDIFG